MAKIISKVSGIIFIAIAYWLVKDLPFNEKNIYNNILLGWLVYFFAYFGVYFLLSPTLEKNYIFSFIYRKILFLPIIGFFYFQYVLAPILALLIFLLIYFLPSIWILRLGETHPILEQYSQGIIYIISLVSVLFFAYKSNILMGFLINILKTKLFKNYLDNYTNIAFTRIYTYIFMITVYISYNFFTFSNINLNFIPLGMLNVTKEVFVTFVAIDSLIQITLNKQEKKRK
ncbi:hypothetical protein [Bacillus inaquosorum]|uniref:hypothetical protein n=1 Tax=Bacillus inaquosorum TaxID=483913 RepID=UPI002282B7EB|nr:hypothetical protein [Bacillus inaquosorum]MCY7758704.1 hypothetical protein [Bacillus inaquosorum]MCY8733636.1 hypothetical protein [Bacillus inaquosorum]MCY9057730.1 hypothetical protein [Bacillus inaquosorum]MCY9270703.1 hypothetical protein [Bacillus inaquosorum]MED0797840.1 hypothetical protein [Bacillus inaquosorum]